MSEDMESKPRSAPASPVMNGRKTVIGEVGIEENHSTGSSVRTNSSGENATDGNKINMFRANTELGITSGRNKTVDSVLTKNRTLLDRIQGCGL